MGAERNDAPSSSSGGGGGADVGGTAAALSTLLLSSLKSLGGGVAATPGNSTRSSRSSVVGGKVTVDRILGSAVTLGLSIALLRLSVQFWHLAWRRRRRRVKSRRGGSRRVGCGEEEDDEVTLPLPLSAYLPLFVHLALRRLMGGGGYDDDGSDGSSSSDLDSSCGSESDSPDSYFRAVHESTDASIDESEFSIEGPIRGSCHCGAVRFALLRRRRTTVGDDEGSTTTMSAYDCPGKIRYPRVRLDAPSAEFQILEGEAYLQMYYDSVVAGIGEDDDEDDAASRTRSRRQSTAAHAFCNQCGVHVLHAPDSDADVLEVNANCLDWDSSNSSRPPARGGGRRRRHRMPPIEVTWRPRPAAAVSRTTSGIDGRGKKSSSSRGAATPSTEGTSASSSSFGSDFSLGVTPMLGGGDGRSGGDANAAVGTPSATRLSSPVATPAGGRSPYQMGDNDDDGISTLAGDATYSSPSPHRGTPREHRGGWPHSSSSPSPSPSSLSASRHSPSSTLTTTPASVTSSSSRRKKKTGGVDPAVREKVLYYMKRHLHTPTPTPTTTPSTTTETMEAAEAEVEVEAETSVVPTKEEAANPGEST